MQSTAELERAGMIESTDIEERPISGEGTEIREGDEVTASAVPTDRTALSESPVAG